MKHIRLFPVLFVLVIVALVVSGFVIQNYHQKHKMSGEKMTGKMSNAVTIASPDDIKWGKGPDGLPAGAQMAVLEGNPAGKDLFTVRLKFPANYEIKPHWHPTQEAVTVLSGSFNVGMGDNFDQSNPKTLKVDGFGVMPAKMHHYAWTTEESVIQLHAIGPFKITYVNPSDDPRGSTTSKREREEEK